MGGDSAIAVVAPACFDRRDGRLLAAYRAAPLRRIAGRRERRLINTHPEADLIRAPVPGMQPLPDGPQIDAATAVVVIGDPPLRHVPVAQESFGARGGADDDEGSADDLRSCESVRMPKPLSDDREGSFVLRVLVGARGFEPPTS